MARRVVFALVTAVAALVVLPASPAGAAVAGGDVLAYGAPHHGSTAGAALNAPLVDLAAAPDGSGYYQVASDGGIFTYGGARYHGSLGNLRLNQPITGIAPTPTGNGYWLVAADGGVFTFGDALYAGSAGGAPPRHKVIALVPTGSGRGYWLVTEGGQVLAYGTAKHFGDRLGQTTSPVVGLAPAPDSHGYFLATADGGVYTFGTARFGGSIAGQRLDEPVVAIDSAPGKGYVLVTRDGAVHTFGGATFSGSAANACKDAVHDVEIRRGGGYWIGTRPLAPASWPAGTHPLDQLAAEERQLTSLLRLKQGCQPGAAPRRGALANPLPGSRQSQSYGQRTHPVFDRPQFHTGVDLAGGGTQALAAGGGTVVEARERTGYGITVVIDHGNGVATTYSHLARASVTAGQKVSTGQAVGTVGRTGFATGDHLHFEVRVHGAHTDPTAWL